MPAAFVKNIGSGTASNTTTATINVPAAGVALGNTIVLRWYTKEAETLSSIVDTGGNTYTEWVPLYAPIEDMWLYRAPVTTALSSGNTIVVTFAGKANGIFVADEFSGLTTTEDAENTGTTGASTSPSIACSPSAAAVLLVGSMLVQSGSLDSFTEDTDTDGGGSWNSLTTATRVDDIIRAAYKITTSAVTQTWNPTLGTSRNWQQQLGSLQATASAFVPRYGFVHHNNPGIL